MEFTTFVAYILNAWKKSIASDNGPKIDHEPIYHASYENNNGVLCIESYETFYFDQDNVRHIKMFNDGSIEVVVDYELYTETYYFTHI